MTGGSDKIKVFECIQCGTCCHGQGGIFINDDDVTGISEFLNMDRTEFLARYTATRIGRLEISVRDDGACHFLKDNVCAIHPVKPKNCRLWPFLPGAVSEEWGFLSMRGNCPGFNPDSTWEQFLEFYKESENEKQPDNN